MRSLRQQPPQAANEILSHRASAPKLHEHRRKQPTHAHHQRRIATVSASQEQVVTASGHGDFDVSAAVVQPVFRSTPWAEEARESDASPDRVRLLFVSESNVCRSVLAEAIMADLLEAHGLAHVVSCESRASKDYNIGEPPDAALQQVAAELELRLPEGAVARQFDHERDIVAFDLVLVMDKFTAADVLREVAVYDTINKAGNYSAKVRMLGQYHMRLSGSTEPDGSDIDDPLYGNVGGDDEQEAVQRTAMIISEACNGLLEFLQQIRAGSAEGSVGFKQQLGQAVSELGQIDWMVPPMLQKSK